MYCKFTATALAPAILSGILSGTLSGSLAGHFVEAAQFRPALAPLSLRGKHPQGPPNCRGQERGMGGEEGEEQRGQDLIIPAASPKGKTARRCRRRCPPRCRYSVWLHRAVLFGEAERGLKFAPKPERFHCDPRGLSYRRQTTQQAPMRSLDTTPQTDLKTVQESPRGPVGPHHRPRRRLREPQEGHKGPYEFQMHADVNRTSRG